jgi:ubiquinone/menaquinone biosynthesis C-methylase UbiE
MRTPEPTAPMVDVAQVAAYTEAGRESGVMASVYLFHTANMSEVIRPGDVVVDLACGPANQLVQVARLNPLSRFIGLDLSLEMLASARALVASSGLRNVELRRADISDLSAFADGSIDTVVSSMALHHLPDRARLERTFREIARILRSNGGLYLADFARLRHAASIDRFATQYADRQPHLFTRDYAHSLHAAFSVRDFARAGAPLAGRARWFQTFGVDFMVACKSPVRRPLEGALLDALRERWSRMPSCHAIDFADLRWFFSGGGLKLSASLERATPVARAEGAQHRSGFAAR